MKVKLTRHVLVEDADVTPTRAGTEVEMTKAKAKEFIAAGLAEEVPEGAEAAPAGASEPDGKKAPEPENKKAPEPENKAAASKKAKEE
jgi:hypothetical protein